MLHCAATILTTEAISSTAEVLTSLRNKGADFWTAKVVARLAPPKEGAVNAEVVAARSSRIETVLEANMVIKCR